MVFGFPGMPFGFPPEIAFSFAGIPTRNKNDLTRVRLLLSHNRSLVYVADRVTILVV
jgi:hypothetical protein